MSLEKKIVIVGSINLDLVINTETIPAVGQTVTGSELQMHPGGKGANQAVAVARLGYPVSMIGRVGDDAFGEQLRGYLSSAGVAIDGVSTTRGASGAALIAVSASGDNSIIVAPGANAHVSPDDIDRNLATIRSAGVVLSQLEIPLETVEYLARVCTEAGTPLILDPAPARRLPSSLFGHIRWFTPNETEAAYYAGIPNGQAEQDCERVAKTLLDKGCGGVILKRGAHGAYLASQHEPAEHIPSFAVNAIDTTAAGDAFNGGFAVGLMKGLSPRDSACLASAVAAISVTRAGAQTSMPSMHEVKEFLNDQFAKGVSVPSEFTAFAHHYSAGEDLQ